ncbi:MAG: O-antigen ligase family protein [Janthinobacterium lividum]
MNTITGQAPYGPAPGRQVAGSTRISWPGYAFMVVFFVVVFEGAGRKWGSAASTIPLILLRDLAALGLVFYAWKSGSFGRYAKVTAIMTAWTCLVVAWGLFQVVAGVTTPVIFAIGLRFWLLYTWFAVAAAATLTEADYKAAVKLALLSLLLMAPLAVLQHYSSTGATINRQIDGDEESVFTVVSGVVRTTGTFSFTTGYANFVTTVAPLAFAVLGARKRTKFNWIVALGAFSAFMVANVISGSRTAIVSAGLMLGVYLMGRLVFSKNRDKPAALAAVVMLLILVTGVAFFLSDAVTVTQQRFEDASAAENVWERTLSILVGEPTVLNAFTWLGSGVGAGSNLATSLRPGATNFGLAESEAGRTLLEGGLLGFAFIALKLVVVIAGFFKSFQLSRKLHSPFPILYWLTLTLGLLTWAAIGQLTANALLGILIGFFLLMFRYPSADFFSTRRR